ncbi:ABC transporter permease [Pokkaliibacter sp. CJK22405]|uniref:ABC transporter permease n=1 Tax=Pokkaliibacter sp. CJK22405 TaxID=3384615 RepID=UPI0039853FC6
MKIAHPVQPTLWLAILVLGSIMPLMGVAPNRILTPKGEYLLSLLDRPLVLLPLFSIVLMLPLFIGQNALRARQVLLVLLCWVAFTSLALFAGRFASESLVDNKYARVSFGGGFWAVALLLWLLAMDALQRLFSQSWQRAVLALLFLCPLIGLVSADRFHDLSLLIEYRSNQEAFDNALGEHLTIVGLTLALTLVMGLALGIFSYRHPRFGRPCLNLLSILQTIPSIALFGLLLAPLSALAKQLPWLSALGISGIGMAPAVIALLLYSLLPMVRATVTGLAQVPAPLLEAARGMGMTERQSLWQVQLRLALPVILSGLRVTTVQAIGLTMVAALIGAGGFGSLMFRGLSASALDLILLGVIPVVALAALADTLFKVLVQFTQPDTRSTSTDNLPAGGETA